MKRIMVMIAVVFAAGAMLLGGGAATATPECSPGQQGNPHPAFKPGVCGKDQQAGLSDGGLSSPNGWSWNG